MPPPAELEACQPAAKNLPVCLELPGTQACPGGDERQRRKGRGDRRVEIKREKTQKRKWTEMRGGEREGGRGISCTAALGSIKLRHREGKQAPLALCSQPTQWFNCRSRLKGNWVMSYSLVGLEDQQALLSPAPKCQKGESTL